MSHSEIKWQQIAFIGEPMLELSKKNNAYHLDIAGDTYNTAVYFRRYLHNNKLSVSYTTGLGLDTHSHTIRAVLTEENINTETIAKIPGKNPGLYMISTNEQGERSFSYWRGDSAARYWMDSSDTDRVLERMSEMDAFYLSGISLAILSNDAKDRLLTFLSKMHNQGKTIIFDNNYRPALWHSREEARAWYDQMMQITDVALLTVDDDQELYGHMECQNIIERCQHQGVREVVLKRGSQSCLVGVSGEQVIEVPSQPIAKVVDTTAAGDSFAAGYLAARVAGKAPASAAADGHKLASIVIQHRGAIIPKAFMPTLEN
ncbi:sugar kinase [Endozoicomonas atrinae]|uniref:sugar kinase n=1 Tax=Endozoicomonas atrinae TaxID=1333660 RepID=UPI000824EF3F|nr:sugar kinase [Endozoicomonas atrinae]